MRSSTDRALAAFAAAAFSASDAGAGGSVILKTICG